jgi:hypothetical protein
MNIKDTSIEFERSITRAQSSLDRRNPQEFRAAIQDLQRLVGKTGRWQSAMNFLARSTNLAPVPASPAAPARG